MRQPAQTASPPRAQRPTRVDKPILFVACALPLAWLVLRAFGAAGLSLGPNPVESLIHGLGSCGLRLLLLTLCVRPAAVLLRRPRLLHLRRTLGLFAFAYLSLHFLAWLVLDQSLDPRSVVADIAKRPYITLGFTALLMLLPLAVTSTDRWMRRLGRRWHTLHRLVYPAALLGCVHFWWQVKADWREPALYVVIYVVLMAWRWRYARQAQARKNSTAVAPVRARALITTPGGGDRPAP